MFVLALVLIAIGAAVVVVGLLALGHRLPRNRVVGIRTPWTMSRVDAFRRANRAAAPALVAAGAVGLVGGAGAAAGDGATAVTLMVVGVVGLLMLMSAAGMIGARYAVADEAVEVAASAPAGPCTLDDDRPDADTGHPGTGRPDADACAQPGPTCAGSCALCPRAEQRG